jgi:hypothetical protein
MESRVDSPLRRCDPRSCSGALSRAQPPSFHRPHEERILRLHRRHQRPPSRRSLGRPLPVRADLQPRSPSIDGALHPKALPSRRCRPLRKTHQITERPGSLLPGNSARNYFFCPRSSWISCSLLVRSSRSRCTSSCSIFTSSETSPAPGMKPAATCEPAVDRTELSA